MKLGHAPSAHSEKHRPVLKSRSAITKKSEPSSSVQKIVEAFEQFESRRAGFALVSQAIDEAVAAGIGNHEWDELNDRVKECAVAQIKRKLGKTHTTRVERFVREGFAWRFDGGVVTTYAGSGDGLVPDTKERWRMIHVDRTIGPEPHPLLMEIVKRLLGITEPKAPDPDDPPGNLEVLRFMLRNWARQGRLYQKGLRTSPELQAQIVEAWERFDRLARGEGFDLTQSRQRQLDEAAETAADLHKRAVEESPVANPEADHEAESLLQCCENVLDELECLGDPAFPLDGRVHLIQQIVQAGQHYAALEKTKDTAVLTAYRNGLRMGDIAGDRTRAIRGACEAVYEERQRRPTFEEVLRKLGAERFKEKRSNYVRFGEFSREPLTAVSDTYIAWCNRNNLRGKRGRPAKDKLC